MEGGEGRGLAQSQTLLVLYPLPPSAHVSASPIDVSGEPPAALSTARGTSFTFALIDGSWRVDDAGPNAEATAWGRLARSVIAGARGGETRTRTLELNRWSEMDAGMGTESERVRRAAVDGAVEVETFVSNPGPAAHLTPQSEEVDRDEESMERSLSLYMASMFDGLFAVNNRDLLALSTPQAGVDSTATVLSPSAPPHLVLSSSSIPVHGKPLLELSVASETAPPSSADRGLGGGGGGGGGSTFPSLELVSGLDVNLGRFDPRCMRIVRSDRAIYENGGRGQDGMASESGTMTCPSTVDCDDDHQNTDDEHGELSAASSATTTEAVSARTTHDHPAVSHHNMAHGVESAGCATQDDHTQILTPDTQLTQPHSHPDSLHRLLSTRTHAAPPTLLLPFTRLIDCTPNTRCNLLCVVIQLHPIQYMEIPARKKGPATTTTTTTTTTVPMGSLLVADPTMSYFPVTLWRALTPWLERLEIGDVLWMKQVAIRSFRDRLSASTLHASTLRVVHRICTDDGVDDETLLAPTPPAPDSDFPSFHQLEEIVQWAGRQPLLKYHRKTLGERRQMRAMRE
ncbi:hypothetical protein DFJ77DRAFT_459796 [Powellomyces hirtus]|nr:hypothetical protein DFJ77DRAFT_459796 [Powellomyces hirtus]